MLGGHKESPAEYAAHRADALDAAVADAARCTIYSADDDAAEYFEFAERADIVAPVSEHTACPYQRSERLEPPRFVKGMRPWQTLQAVRPPQRIVWPGSFMEQSRVFSSSPAYARATDYAEAQVVDEDRAVETPADDTEVLARTARDILASLDVQDDPMLQRSRFVSYLRGLAGNHHAQTAAGAKIGYADPAVAIPGLDRPGYTDADRQWDALDKPWRTHEATGFGYAHYARGAYALQDFAQPADTAAGAAESVLRADPTLSAAWLALGIAHQAGEMDALAIPALYRATDLAPGDANAWLALASSLANESCIPDALDALRNLVIAYLGEQSGTSTSPNTHRSLEDPRVRAMESNDPQRVVEAFERAFPDACAAMLTGPRRALSLAATIAYSLARQHDRALSLLQSDTSRGEDDPAPWILMNRLGATLANAGDYKGALETYAALESAHGQCARVAYNRGIALLCSERAQMATAAFLEALRMQDARYVSRSPVWDALGVAAELSGNTLVAAFVSARDYEGILSLAALDTANVHN